MNTQNVKGKWRCYPDSKHMTWEKDENKAVNNQRLPSKSLVVRTKTISYILLSRSTHSLSWEFSLLGLAKWPKCIAFTERQIERQWDRIKKKADTDVSVWFFTILLYLADFLQLWILFLQPHSSSGFHFWFRVSTDGVLRIGEQTG